MEDFFMKFKKVIGLGLSVIMTAMSCNLSFADGLKLNDEISVVSDGVDLADSSNSFNKYVTVKDGEFSDSLSIVIQPMGEVDMDSKITFELENGVFDEEAMDEATSGAGLDYYSYKAFGLDETYDFLRDEFKEYEADMGFERAFAQVFQRRMQTARTVELPYKLRKVSDTEMEVTLFAIPDVYAGEKFADVSKPKYKIPLPFKAKGNENVKLNINSANTSIRGGTYTIAKIEGSDEDYIYSTGSENSVSKYITVENGDFNDSLNFVIKPKFEVDMDSKITFKLQNGVFDAENVKTDSDGYLIDYRYEALGSDCDYDFLKREYNEYKANMAFDRAFAQVFMDRMMINRTVELPYKLRKVSDTEMEVTLFALPDVYANEKFAGVGKPKYKIPLPFKATGDGNVKVSVDSDNTSISNGTYTIAKTIGSDEEYGQFNGSYNNVNNVFSVKDGDFRDEGYLRIQPKFEVDMDSRIILKLENGVFDEEDMKNTSGQSVGLSKYDYNALGRDVTYDFLKAEFESYEADTGFEMAFLWVFQQRMQTARTEDLPYKLRKISDTEMEVTLFALPDVYANEKFADVNKPVYKIPVPFTATGGDVTVSLKTENTSISNSKHTIGIDLNSSGVPLELGDVDGIDGVTANDAALVLDYVLRKDTNGFAKDGLKVAKVTKGTKITALDAAAILLKALDVTDEFVFEIENNK